MTVCEQRLRKQALLATASDIDRPQGGPAVLSRLAPCLPKRTSPKMGRTSLGRDDGSSSILERVLIFGLLCVMIAYLGRIVFGFRGGFTQLQRRIEEARMSPVVEEEEEGIEAEDKHKDRSD